LNLVLLVAAAAKKTPFRPVEASALSGAIGSFFVFGFAPSR
jgi:hypothetical protein